MCRRAGAAANRVLIVTTSLDSAFGAAIDGIQGVLAGHSVSASVLRLPNDEASVRQELEGGTCQIAIAVGAEAVRAVAAYNRRIPMIATMTFRDDVEPVRAQAGAESKATSGVWLDLSVATVAAGLRIVFPDAAKLGVVRSPSARPLDGATATSTLPPGVSLKSVSCSSAAELIACIRTLRGQVEFLICLPDSGLYNKTTVEPLILASIEHRVPLVGFSASFARAGAAVGVYPDFTEVGRQTAALCERTLAAPSTAKDEFPRRTAVAVNERVLHLLGRDYRSTQRGEVVVFR